MTDFSRSDGILPGFLEGFKLISQDEHRHVAYGTWFLQQKAQDPALRRSASRTLMRAAAVAAGVLVPTGARRSARYELLGYTSEEMNEFAFTALSAG